MCQPRTTALTAETAVGVFTGRTSDAGSTVQTHPHKKHVFFSSVFLAASKQCLLLIHKQQHQQKAPPPRPQQQAFLSYNQMGRVTKQGATTSWDASHAALYQKGFRDLHWDPLETKGLAIKDIIEGAISTDGDFESLRWLFSKTQGGEKDSNSNLYYHYKEEASEYITQLARIGIRSMC